MKINKITISFLLLSSVLFAQTRPPENENSLRNRAEMIHKSVITIDTHDDIDVQNFTELKNYTADLDTQVNLPKMISGGLDVAWLIVYSGQGSLDRQGYKEAYENAMAKFDAIHRLVDSYASDQIELALSAEDVKRIHSQGKKVAMIGVENAYPIGEDLEEIEEFYKLGARYMSLAHNGHSQFSDSHTGEKDSTWLHNGLSPLGKKAIAEMNRLGIMVDISHPSRQAIVQMMKLSKAPVLASHSSARSLSDVSRNLDNELLKLLKSNGGVVQVVAVDQYLNIEKYNENLDAKKPLYEQVSKTLGIPNLTMDEVMKLPKDEQEEAWLNFKQLKDAVEEKSAEINKRYPPVDVTDLVDHIDYIVNLIGIDHVGISSDFDGGGGISGWNNAAETFNVTYELVKRGYTEEEIAKLWGLNLLRVMEQVSKKAQELQKS